MTCILSLQTPELVKIFLAISLGTSITLESFNNFSSNKWHSLKSNLCKKEKYPFGNLQEGCDEKDFQSRDSF